MIYFNIHSDIWIFALFSSFSQRGKQILRLDDFKTTQLVRTTLRKQTNLEYSTTRSLYFWAMPQWFLNHLSIHSFSKCFFSACYVSRMAISSGQYSGKQISLNFAFMELLVWCIQSSLNSSSSLKPPLVHVSTTNSLICVSRACYT